MHSLYLTEQIRAAEQAALAKLPPGTLMQRAGKATADLANSLIAPGSRVLVLVGPGNNGGDGLEAAADLAQAGHLVTVLRPAARHTLSDDAAHALRRAQGGAVRFVDGFTNLPDADLVIDALFGIGLARPIEGEVAQLVMALNAKRCKVLAIDIPSGLDADTGCVSGPAVRATHTITFLGDKPGLYTADGRDHAGIVRIESLGVHMPSSLLQFNSPQLFAEFCRRRSHASHKGSFGNVAILGGAKGMDGAPILAARTALMAGAGRVYVAQVEPGLACDPVHPEIMVRDGGQFDYAGAVVVAGPGMGTERHAGHLLDRAVDAKSALVLDADALNLLAKDIGMQARLADRDTPAIITPHPLEAARLLGMTASVVQQDRLTAAQELASRLNAIVVLKGSGTVIATPDGKAIINGTGNPGLATAGSGDVLSGLIGALLAQGWTRQAAALGGVYLHGLAADVLVKDGIGPIGLTAGELAPAIRRELNRLSA